MSSCGIPGFLVKFSGLGRVCGGTIKAGISEQPGFSECTEVFGGRNKAGLDSGYHSGIGNGGGVTSATGDGGGNGVVTSRGKAHLVVD